MVPPEDSQAPFVCFYFFMHLSHDFKIESLELCGRDSCMLTILKDGKALQEKAAKKAEKAAGSGDAGGKSTKK
ncbi:hypothetical protein Tco_1527357 [Tanacetum coccineum]